MLQLLTEPAWQRFIAKHSVSDEAGAANYIEERLLPSYANDRGLWVMQLESDAQPIGICGLVKRPYLEETDLGFALLEKYWGLGYAAEASSAVINYARDELQLSRLWAITTPGNQQSIQLLKKLGFVFEREIENPEKEQVSLFELLL